ncbi:MAG: hypothetical protein NVSMB58_37650 [Terriglobales bacterium]
MQRRYGEPCMHALEIWCNFDSDYGMHYNLERIAATKEDVAKIEDHK